MLVSNIKINDLYNLIGKKVKFTADCQLFPNFNITGILENIEFTDYEKIFTLNINNKKYTIGSNMPKLNISTE